MVKGCLHSSQDFVSEDLIQCWRHCWCTNFSDPEHRQGLMKALLASVPQWQILQNLSLSLLFRLLVDSPRELLSFLGLMGRPSSGSGEESFIIVLVTIWVCDSKFPSCFTPVKKINLFYCWENISAVGLYITPLLGGGPSLEEEWEKLLSLLRP